LHVCLSAHGLDLAFYPDPLAQPGFLEGFSWRPDFLGVDVGEPDGATPRFATTTRRSAELPLGSIQLWCLPSSSSALLGSKSFENF